MHQNEFDNLVSPYPDIGTVQLRKRDMVNAYDGTVEKSFPKPGKELDIAKVNAVWNSYVNKVIDLYSDTIPDPNHRAWFVHFF